MVDQARLDSDSARALLRHINTHQRTPDQRLHAISICVDVSSSATVFGRGFGGKDLTQF